MHEFPVLNWRSLRRQLWGWVIAAVVVLPVVLLSPVTAAAEPVATTDNLPADQNLPPRLRQLELEQLMEIEVSTVSRTESTVGESAAAVFVITQEDIRRSGATTIAELFRRVPGMDVARIDNNKWAISSRGFNDRYADMLLVQMDGRTVYNPLFAGVYWDVLVYPLEDIQRIEVIRGPGASVWGANAVNGVINIITKSAKDTEGGRIIAGGGSQDLAFGTMRYGGQLADNAWYRVYGEGFDRWKNQFSEGEINDKWYVGDIGSRLDWDISKVDAVFFDWQYIHARTGRGDLLPQLAPPFFFRDLDRDETDAGHVLGRWTHTISKDSSLTLQLYWDHFQQDVKNLQQHFRWDTYDLDFQHGFPLGERQKVTYGFGYRLIEALLPDSGLDDGFILTWRHPRREIQLFSGFVQDQIALVRDKLSLLIGTKLEHNDFTGFEVQPTGRLLWAPTARQSTWVGVSRAVRTPSLVEDEMLLRLVPVATSPVVIFPRVTFNTGFQSEEIIAYELGYRAQTSENHSLDLAAFYNDYRRLRMAELGTPTPGPGGSLSLPLVFENRMKGETYGVELATDWRPTRWWRLYGAYTFLEMKLHADRSLPAESISAAESNEGHSPRHQVYLQSSWDVGGSVEFDLMGRYVSKLTGLNPRNTPGLPDVIASYFSMDARLAWRLLKNLELSVVGQNLLDNHHPEFSSGTQRQALTEIRRSVYGRVKWDF